MKTIVTMLSLLLFCGVSHATPTIHQKDCADGMKRTGNTALPFDLTHNHCYEDIDTDTDTDTDTNTQIKVKSQIGAGVDTYLYRSERFDIEQQSKWDWNNGRGSYYVVGQIKTEKGLLQYLFSGFKGLFVKD